MRLAPGSSNDFGDDGAERVAARLEIAELVEGCGGGRQQDDIAGLRVRHGVADRGVERAAMLDRHQSGEVAGEHRGGIADQIGAGDIAEMRGAFANAVFLGEATGDPVDAGAAIGRGRVGRERRGGGGGVGRLAVVDEQDAVCLGDAFHAVGEAGVGAESLLDGFIR